MIKSLLILILSLFQDNYVRIGTIFGAIIGFWSADILQVDPIKNCFSFGFVGWGIGAYLASYFDFMNKPSKKKFRFIKGGKN